ncbi:hypothetical protein ACWCOV_20210, partial [Kribbella sp. NPDC002412]
SVIPTPPTVTEPVRGGWMPASQVVRFLVPSYVQDDPSLARVIDESLADQVADLVTSSCSR